MALYFSFGTKIPHYIYLFPYRCVWMKGLGGEERG